MGQNKKQTQKTREVAGGKGLLGPVGAITVMFALLAGAIFYSQPSGKLENYKRGDSTEPASAVSNQGKTEPASTPSNGKNSAAAPEPAFANEGSDAARQATSDPEVIKVSETPDPSFPKVSRKALVHLDQAIKFVEEGKFNTAEQEFEKAEALSPEAPEIQAIWASALKLQKKFKGADLHFAKADELAPNDAEILFNWGMLKLEDRQADEAIKLFEKTVELDPDNFLVYNYLGKALGQRKKYAEETKMYEKALELKPDFAQAHFNMAVVLSLQNMVAEAAPHFERAIELDKEFEKPFVVDMLKAMGRYQGPEVSKEKREKAPVATAKLTPSDEEKKSEGSDHKMEEGSNSKEVRSATNVKGKVLVNNESIGPGAIVFLETKTKLKIPGQSVQELTIDQKNLTFSPAHSVVQVGSTVVFVNQDNEVHNIFSKSLNNQFNLGAMAGGASKSIKFTQAGPVILRCNLHKDMIGTLFVVPNGYYTQTNEAGEYEFRDLTNQDYLLQVWHPRLYPEEVGLHVKSYKLNGADVEHDFAVVSASKPGEVHDLVDDVDYRAIADVIEKEVFQAIEDWKAGKKYMSRKRMLMALTKHFAGMGLKGAVAKSFSEKRAQSLENQLDVIRKKISGLGKYKEGVTEEGLKSETRTVMSQIRNSIQELEARLHLSPPGKRLEAD